MMQTPRNSFQKGLYLTPLHFDLVQHLKAVNLTAKFYYYFKSKSLNVCLHTMLFLIYFHIGGTCIYDIRNNTTFAISQK